LTESTKKKRSPIWIWVLIGVPVLGVCLIGIMIAIAVPAFTQYVQKSKAAEAAANLQAMYQGAAGYYATTTHCTVDSARTPNVPGAEKTILDPAALHPSFDAIEFGPMDPLYYEYEIVTAGPGRCNNGPGEPLYSFRAHGDLDGDGTQSLHEYTAESDEANELRRSHTLHTVDELE
jgi:type II secretory pathway pseudopilin PulG